MSRRHTVLALVLLLLAGWAEAATLTVAPGDSLQAAVDRAQPGDTVLVMPGTYGAVVATRSGTAAAPIRFMAQTCGTARITGPDFILWASWGDYIIIEGFDIEGVGGMPPLGGSGQIGIISYGSHVHIRRNQVHNLRSYDCWTPSARAGTGILTGIETIEATDIVVDSNHIYDNGGGYAAACPAIGRGPHGIYAVWPGRVTNNVVNNNRGNGISIWHRPSEVLVENNLVYHNGWGGVTVGGHEAPVHDIIVRHNIFYDNGAFGIREEGSNTPTNIFSNNLVYGNRRGNVSLRVGTGTGNIERDPQFAHYTPTGRGNLTLLPTSPMAGFTPDSPDPCQGATGLEGPGLSETEEATLIAQVTRDVRAELTAQQATLPRIVTPVMPMFPSLPGRPGT